MKSGGFRKRISVDKALICFTRRMAYHRCSSIYKCVNDLTGRSLDIVRRSDIHSYNTRNKEVMNWGQPCCSIDPRLAVWTGHVHTNIYKCLVNPFNLSQVRHMTYCWILLNCLYSFLVNRLGEFCVSSEINCCVWSLAIFSLSNNFFCRLTARTRVEQNSYVSNLVTQLSHNSHSRLTAHESWTKLVLVQSGHLTLAQLSSSFYRAHESWTKLLRVQSDRSTLAQLWCSQFVPGFTRVRRGLV